MDSKQVNYKVSEISASTTSSVSTNTVTEPAVTSYGHQVDSISQRLQNILMGDGNSNPEGIELLHQPLAMRQITAIREESNEENTFFYNKLKQKQPDNPSFNLDNFIIQEDKGFECFLAENGQDLFCLLADAYQDISGEEICEIQVMSDYPDESGQHPHLKGKIVLITEALCYKEIQSYSGHRNKKIKTEISAKGFSDLTPIFELSTDIDDFIKNFRLLFSFSVLQGKIDESARCFNSGDISPFTGWNGEPIERFFSADMQFFSFGEKILELSSAANRKKEEALKQGYDVVDSHGSYFGDVKNPIKIYYV